MLDPSCALQSVSISHHLAVKSRSVVQTLYIYNLSTGSSLWLYVYNSWTRRVTTGIISPGNAVCLSDILFSANVMWHRGRMFDQRRWKVSWDVARWWISGFQPCWVRGPGGWEKKETPRQTPLGYATAGERSETRPPDLSWTLSLPDRTWKKTLSKNLTLSSQSCQHVYCMTVTAGGIFFSVL